MNYKELVGYVIVEGSLERGLELRGLFATEKEARENVCSDPHVEILPVYKPYGE